MAKKVAADFQKSIDAARDRKKNEDLAASIFGRRASAPQRGSVPGGSLASRAGVKKRGSTGPGPRAGGNINGEWTHDLHETKAAARPGSLASRITAPGARGPPTQPRAQRRAAQVERALMKSEASPHSAAQVNFVNRAQRNGISIGGRGAAVGGGAPAPRGMSIRGLAGPFVIMAQNFAPGTTAADIESAMTPIGGLIQSCRIIKANPIMIAEIVFESKEGADLVIAQFNNTTADGRLLHVYPKIGGASPAVRDLITPPTGPRASIRADPVVVNGTMGFGDEPMDEDDGGRLYSDQLVSSSSNGNGSGNRRRSGFRGGRGGNR